MKIKYFIAIICISTFCLLSSYQLSAQQYHKVVKGNDNPATEEQVFDDVKTIADILTKYKISESKTTPTKENYNFWVEFVSKNKMSIKRKEMIYSFLGEMKSKLKS